MIKAIFFDFDGVLADTESLHLAAFQKVLKKRGFELTAEAYFKEYIGYDDRGAFAAFFKNEKAPKNLLDPASIRTCIAEKTQVFQELARAKAPLYNGVAELLPQWAARWPLAIVSGALGHEVKLILAPGDHLKHFQFIVSADECKESKPSPEPYRLALKTLNKKQKVAAKEILVVEDSRAGIQSAKGAGMITIGILRSYAKPADLETADHVINDLRELTAPFIKTFA